MNQTVAFKFAIVTPLVKTNEWSILLWLKNSILNIRLDRPLNVNELVPCRAVREKNLSKHSVLPNRWKIYDEGTYTLLQWKANSFTVSLTGNIILGIYSFTEGSISVEDMKKTISKATNKLNDEIKTIKSTILKKTHKKNTGVPVSNMQHLTVELNKRNKKLKELKRGAINSTTVKKGAQQWLVTKLKT
jgi:hypothetical protein